MLQLRPTCEHCNKLLPPDSTEAMICTYECTFCSKCVEILENVCPNCGGGFCPRPIRPTQDLIGGMSLSNYPATEKITYKPVDLEKHSVFSSRIKVIPSEKR